MGDTLEHYGMPRRSGRYPWGSGQDPQRHVDFRTHVQNLRKQGVSEVDIAKGEGMTTTQLRSRLSSEKAKQRAADTAEAVRLKDKGLSGMEIGRRMGRNESSVRSLLDPVLEERSSLTKKTAAILKGEVDEKRFIDVGTGVENHMGVNRNRLNLAVRELERDGYKVHRVNVPQVGIPGQFTIVKALGKPDTTWSEVVRDPTKIKPIDAYSKDYGRSFDKGHDLGPVQSISSKRIKVHYAEDGGTLKDGVIELRRGVKDLDLGQSKYAQVRIAVDKTHYMKGMAIYRDGMPEGVDVIYNTAKKRGTPALGHKDDTVLKPIKDDPENPFGSTIKKDGRRGALNVVNEEGDWDRWSKTLSSQILSKQSVPLARKQLGLDLKQKQSEHDEINSLTNPEVKKKLLSSFADDCDSSSVHLKAASLPRQASKVILPVTQLKETEIYAPSFNNGERVVLIRHPHAGTFEIPELTVNNNSRTAKSVLGTNPRDAVGIHPNVAKKLSGADFDGDSVIVIPNNRGHIRTSASLKSLDDFDPIELYHIPAGSKIPPIKPQVKQTKMGEVSNLITDMTIKGASTAELARAVRHSMVVIDSEKHNLDYRQSYVDHGISQLSERYQNTKQGGAGTLVSRSKSRAEVPVRRPRSMAEGGPINPRTGEKVYTPTGATYTIPAHTIPAHLSPKGRLIPEKHVPEVVKPRMIVSTKMAETHDAHTLSSGRPVENAYAEYANSMKGLANESRKQLISIKSRPTSVSAKKVYASEVASLDKKLKEAVKNKPLERQAQILANSIVKRKKDASPDMEKDDLKKVRNQALSEARTRTGAKKALVEITDKEWEAIQAGAISPSKLGDILDNTDLNRVKQLATPRKIKTIAGTKLNRAHVLLSTGATHAQVAEALGISVKTLNDSLYTEKG
jgi:DNA-binding CsgD family transcriptional regulator